VAAKQSVAICIRGKEFRVRSDEDAASLQRIAAYLDETMAKVEERTGTVDSLDVALLTALNLARELVARRDRASALPAAGSGRLRSLIELAESGLGPPPA
jgi:cell division protein ZapA